MEMNEDDFLEELLALKREIWELTNPSSLEINGLFSTNNPTSSSWLPFDGLDSSTLEPANPNPNPSIEPINPNPCLFTTDAEFYQIPTQQPIYPAQTQAQYQPGCKEEPAVMSSLFNVGVCNNNDKSSSSSPCSNNKSKIKKIEGQPSKNLMAERRRRKRLNDRLSMLRSVVPKISKLDRTSILGDTIDYMKELIEKIDKVQEDIGVDNSNQLSLMSISKDVKPDDNAFVRNSPKFEVEKRNLDIRVHICCTGKPGLLLSTITTLEALGLEIQQCVISCFNDFSVRASCSEEMEQKSCEEIKEALFRNAGYGGRCL